MTDKIERQLRKAAKKLLTAYNELGAYCIRRNEDRVQGRFMTEEEFGEIDEAAEDISKALANKRKAK